MVTCLELGFQQACGQTRAKSDDSPLSLDYYEHLLFSYKIKV